MLTLQPCQWASWHHGNQSHHSPPECACVFAEIACVCALMGGIRVLFSFKKLRRGHSRPYGPLAVIHVNSLKTPAALFSSLSLSWIRCLCHQCSSMQNGQLLSFCEIPPLTSFDGLPAVIMMVLLCDTSDTRLLSSVMSSARVNRDKINTKRTTIKLYQMSEASVVCLPDLIVLVYYI